MSAVKFNIGGRAHPRYRIVQGNIMPWALRGTGGATPVVKTLDYRRHRANWYFLSGGENKIFRWPCYGSHIPPPAPGTAGGHFLPTRAELRRQKRAAKLAEAQRAREWEALNADRAGLRSDIKELLSPTPKPVVIEPAPVVAAASAQPPAQPAPQIIPIKPVFAEIPDDDEERELELILLSL